nr:hypothetical protein [Mycoplasmopsis bovis]
MPEPLGYWFWLSWVCGLVFEEELSEPLGIILCSFLIYLMSFDYLSGGVILLIMLSSVGFLFSHDAAINGIEEIEIIEDKEIIILFIFFHLLIFFRKFL